MDQKKGPDVKQHWGFKRRFEYQPEIPKKGEKIKNTFCINQSFCLT